MVYYIFTTFSDLNLLAECKNGRFKTTPNKILMNIEDVKTFLNTCWFAYPNPKISTEIFNERSIAYKNRKKLIKSTETYALFASAFGTSNDKYIELCGNMLEHTNNGEIYIEDPTTSVNIEVETSIILEKYKECFINSQESSQKIEQINKIIEKCAQKDKLIHTGLTECADICPVYIYVSDI